MVLINGTDPEPWLGEVMTVDVTNQLAKVRYYIRNGEREVGSILVDLFVSERNACLDQVSWNAIVCAAIGEWNGNTWGNDAFYVDSMCSITVSLTTKYFTCSNTIMTDVINPL